MLRPLIAGVAYFGVVFAFGFALGVLRATLVAPRLGETVAVVLELPIMLAVSWAACRWLTARFAVSADRTARVVMGGIAFAVLLTADLGTSLLIVGRTIPDHFDHYRDPSGLLGLAGQLAFAAFPLAQSARRPRRGG